MDVRLTLIVDTWTGVSFVRTDGDGEHSTIDITTGNV